MDKFVMHQIWQSCIGLVDVINCDSFLASADVY